MKLNPNDKDLIAEVSDLYKCLPKSVKNHVSNKTLEKLVGYLYEIEGCESPIEQLLGFSLSIQMNRIDLFADATSFLQQQNIKTKHKTYRVDFLIQALKMNRSVSYIIECDGHDYHEKTKEQAKRDKQRDRHLINEGYKVLRFTGSEIYENPHQCSNEIIRLIIKDLTSGE